MATEHKSGEQGTGRHPHKSTEEPYPHTKTACSEHGERSGRHEASSHSEHSSGKGGSSEHHPGQHRSEHHAGSHSGGSEADDLKSREYKDKEGNIHHHTRTSSAMHEKK